MYLLIHFILFLATSCAPLPKGDGTKSKSDPPLTKYQEAHARFQEQPNHTTLIYQNSELLQLLTPDNARIEVTLSALRAQIFVGDEVAIDTPVSPGKKSHPTPTGNFKIIGKDKDHRSSIYGTIYGLGGKWVASGDRRKHMVPSGGKYVGVKLPYWMRLTNTGIGLHVGHVPNYPASHGCVRLPSKIAPIIYEKTRVGTPVTIKP